MFHGNRMKTTTNQMSDHKILRVQVRLCDDASFSQQDKRNEAVGAALDQKLSVWRSMEEDPSNTHLNIKHLNLTQVNTRWRSGLNILM